MVIVHGVCVGSWDKFHTNVAPYAVGPVVALSGQTSIADAYNTILDAAFMQWGDDMAVVLQHDDLQITDPQFVPKLAQAMLGDVALVGVAGARGVASLAWWNYDTVGHQHTDGGLIDFGPRSGDVDALEGSLLAFTPWAVAHLRFDHRLSGFHGYDVLVSHRARRAGKRVVVADIDTHHHTRVGFKSAASEGDWQQAEQHYQRTVTAGAVA